MANGTRASRLINSLIVSLLAVAACETPINERLLEIDQQGAVLLFLFRDDNIDGIYSSASDRALIGRSFALRMRGASDDHSVSQTDTAGFSMVQAPAGRYTLSVASEVLGDSLEIVTGGAEFTIAAADTVRQDLGLAYLTMGAGQARTTRVGQRIWLAGTALNSPTAFGDSTVHVSDGAVAIRALRVRPTGIIAGDSVLFLGRITQFDGQPALTVNVQIVRGMPVTVAPDSVSTATAAEAAGGTFDAGLVRVANAAISQVATDPAGNLILTVDDGSGPLRIVLSRNRNWSPVNQFVIGAILDASGVLVPDPAQSSVWVLKPRVRTDLLVF